MFVGILKAMRIFWPHNTCEMSLKWSLTIRAIALCRIQPHHNHNQLKHNTSQALICVRQRYSQLIAPWQWGERLYGTGLHDQWRFEAFQAISNTILLLPLQILWSCTISTGIIVLHSYRGDTPFSLQLWACPLLTLVLPVFNRSTMVRAYRRRSPSSLVQP